MVVVLVPLSDENAPSLVLEIGVSKFKILGREEIQNSNPPIPSALHGSMPLQCESNALEARTEVIQSELGPQDDLEKLESEVKKMAAEILEYRRNLPVQLKTTLSSFLSAQRPALTGAASGSDFEPSLRNLGSEQVELAGEEDKNAEKILLLKHKISNNVSTMPLVIKRLNECVSRIDSLDSCNVSIPPAFKRRKTS